MPTPLGLVWYGPPPEGPAPVGPGPSLARGRDGEAAGGAWGVEPIEDSKQRGGGGAGGGACINDVGGLLREDVAGRGVEVEAREKGTEHTEAVGGQELEVVGHQTAASDHGYHSGQTLDLGSCTAQHTTAMGEQRGVV